MIRITSTFGSPYLLATPLLLLLLLPCPHRNRDDALPPPEGHISIIQGYNNGRVGEEAPPVVVENEEEDGDKAEEAGHQGIRRQPSQQQRPPITATKSPGRDGADVTADADALVDDGNVRPC
jgi:hypothetical protein